MIRAVRLVPICIVTSALVAGLAGVGHAQKDRPERKGPSYRVVIDSEPRGATIYLEGREYGEVGTTPHTAELQAGTWKLILEKDGYMSKVTTFDVKRQRRRQLVKLSLEQTNSGVVAVSAPEGDIAYGAAVLIDGERVGEVPDEFEIEAGPHQVVIEPADGEPYEEWVQIEAGQRLDVEPDLGPAPERDDVVDEIGAEAVARPQALDAHSGDLQRALLVLSTGIDAAGRHFSFVGDQTDNLRPYDADAVPLFHIGVELYPLANYDNASFRALGLVASFDYALSITSSFKDGTEVASTWTQAEAGLRIRIPAGKQGLVNATVTYGTTAFTFDIEGSRATEVPAVDYRYLRYGLDARYTSGRLGLFAGGSFMQVSEAGDVAKRFRDAEAMGIGAIAGFGWRLGPNVEARLTGRYNQFQQAFTTAPGDMFIADSAVDHMYGVMLGGAYIY